MQEKWIPIGKMAEINHVSIATLRLYDEIGLLKPAYIDSESKYRYYTIEQNARLDLIAYMKDLGMSLKEIQNVLNNENIDEIEEVLSRKKEQIYQELRTLKARLNLVDDSIARIERYRNSPKTGICSLEYISRRYIYGIPCSHDFYKQGILGYEKDLLCLRNNLIEKGLEQIYSYNVGTSIAKEDIEKGKLIAKDIFIFSDHKIESVPMKIVDASMFVTLYLSSFEDENEGIEKLLGFCKKNNYTIAGDYLCEVITEFNIFDVSKRSMFLRIQIPVKFY